MRTKLFQILQNVNYPHLHLSLLIVIVIIAILASVGFVTALVMEQARKAEAKNEVTNLVNAIKMYELEYGSFRFKLEKVVNQIWKWTPFRTISSVSLLGTMLMD